MATRSRVGFKNSDGTVNASYVHFDGYLEGVGIALQYNHNNDSAAKKLGYAKGIRSIEADTPVSFYGDMDNEVYESEDDFYNSYDVDYAYLYDPARGWLFASEEYDTPGFIELEDQLLADEIVPGSGERTDDVNESGKKLDIDARDTLEDEAELGLEERLEAAVKENIVKDTIKNTMSKKYMFNPVLGLAGAVYDKVMGKLDKDKIKDEDDLIDAINADPKLSKEEKLAAIEHIKKDPELAKALVGDNDDFDWKSYEDEQKKSKSFGNFMGKWFNKIMTGDTMIQGNFLDPWKLLDKLDAKKNRKDPNLKGYFDKEDEKKQKAASTVAAKEKEIKSSGEEKTDTPKPKAKTTPKDWNKATDEEIRAIGGDVEYGKERNPNPSPDKSDDWNDKRRMLIPPKGGWPDDKEEVEEGIETETKKLKKIAQALKKASKSHGQQAKELEKSIKEIHDPLRGNTLKEHFNRFK